MSALASMPGLGLLRLDPQAPLREVSGSASFSKAVSLSAEPGLPLLPAVLTEEDTQGQVCTTIITGDNALFVYELHRMKPHRPGIRDKDV